nr:hypothetical protein Iba_chr13aCG8990 [Ipomoea batatas]
MKVMTRNSDFQLSDFNFDFFVDVSNKVSDACGEAFSNLSAVLKSNQSSSLLQVANFNEICSSASNGN